MIHNHQGAGLPLDLKDYIKHMFTFYVDIVMKFYLWTLALSSMINNKFFCCINTLSLNKNYK